MPHLLIEVLPETVALNSPNVSTTSIQHLARLLFGAEPSLCIDDRYIDLWFGPRPSDDDLYRLVLMVEAFGFTVERREGRRLHAV
jgi:hypothetical protein